MEYIHYFYRPLTHKVKHTLVLILFSWIQHAQHDSEQHGHHKWQVAWLLYEYLPKFKFRQETLILLHRLSFIFGRSTRLLSVLHNPVLHNSKSPKGQIISINLRAAKRDFVVVWTKLWKQISLLLRGGASATFSTLEKALAGSDKNFRGPHAARGQYVVQSWHNPFRSCLSTSLRSGVRARTYYFRWPSTY